MIEKGKSVESLYDDIQVLAHIEKLLPAEKTKELREKLDALLIRLSEELVDKLYQEHGHQYGSSTVS